MKKLMSLVLAMLMILSCTSYVFAKDVTIEDGKDAAYVVSDATVVEGENVTVSISVVIADDYTAGVGGSEIDIEFPTDKLTYVSASSPLGNLASINPNNAANGKLRVAYMDDIGLVFDADNTSKVLDIVFSPVNGATGTAEVKVAESTTLYDATDFMNDVAFQIVNGTVTFPATKYKATFTVDGEPYAEAEYEMFDTILAPETDPEKSGFEFKGWEGFTEGMRMGSDDVTFEAIFEEIVVDDGLAEKYSGYDIYYLYEDGTTPKGGEKDTTVVGLEKAVEKYALDGTKAVFALVDDFVASTNEINHGDADIVVTSAGGGINMSSHLHFINEDYTGAGATANGSSVTFENIDITAPTSEKFITATGSDFTVKSASVTDGNGLCIQAVKDGSSPVSDVPYVITVDDTNVSELRVCGYNGAAVTADINYVVKNNSVISSVSLAGQSNGKASAADSTRIVNGDVTLDMLGGQITSYVRVGGAAVVNGNVYVNMNGGNIAILYTTGSKDVSYVDGNYVVNYHGGTIGSIKKHASGKTLPKSIVLVANTDNAGIAAALEGEAYEDITKTVTYNGNSGVASVKFETEQGTEKGKLVLTSATETTATVTGINETVNLTKEQGSEVYTATVDLPTLAEIEVEFGAEYVAPVVKYTATFKVDGEVYGEVAEYEEGDEIAAPEAAPEKADHTFKGWAIDGTTDILTFPQTMGTEDVVYVAIFEEIEEDEETEANIATIATYYADTNEYTVDIYFYGQKATTVAFGYTYGADLVYEGFTYGEGLLASEFIPDEYVTVDETNRRLVNVVAPDTETGVIDGTDGEVHLGTYTFKYIGDEEFDAENADHNISLAAPAEAVEYISSTTNYFYTEHVFDLGINTYNIVFDEITVSVDEGTLAPVTYTATFTVDGEVYGEVAEYEEGDEIAAPTAQPTKAEHKFLGWAIEGTTDILTFPQTMGTENVTYDAIFKRIITVMSNSQILAIYTPNTGAQDGFLNYSHASFNASIAALLGEYNPTDKGLTYDEDSDKYILSTNYHEIASVARLVPIYTNHPLNGMTINNTTGTSTKYPGSEYNVRIEGSGVISAHDVENVEQYRYLVYYDTGANGNRDKAFTPKIYYRAVSDAGNGRTAQGKSITVENDYITGRWEYIYFEPEDITGRATQIDSYLFGDANVLGKNFTDDEFYVAEIALLHEKETFKQYRPVELGNSVAGQISNVASDVEYRLAGAEDWIAVDGAANYDAATKTLSGLAGGTYELRYAAKAATDTVGAYAASEAATVTIEGAAAPVVTYTATFTVDGEVYGEVAEYEEGDEIAAPAAAPEKADHTFKGWAIEGTTTVLTFPQTMGTEDVVYVAIFEEIEEDEETDANIRTVATYYSETDDYKVDVYFYGQKATTVAFGYEYGKDLDYIDFTYGEGLLADSLIPEEIVLVDEVNRKLVNVVACSDEEKVIDGTEDKVHLGTYTFKYIGDDEFDKENEDHNIALTTPDKAVEGVTSATHFLYTEYVVDLAVNAYRVIFDDVVVEIDDSTVVPTKYTATFKVDGEVYGDVAEYAQGEEIVAPATNPEKADHTFNGWAAEGTTAVLTFPQTMGTANVVYVAIFEANTPAPTKYTATFKVDGEVYGDVAEYAQGEEIVAPATNPEKADHTFLGWAAEGTTAVLTFPQTMGTANVVYVAVFEETSAPVVTYTATFMNGTETVGEVKSYEAGAAIEVPAAPTKAGNIFKGWALEGSTDIVTEFVMGTENVVYVAIFEAVDATLVLTDLYINSGDTTVKYTHYGVTADMLKAESTEIIITLPYGWNTEIIPQAGTYSATNNPAVITPVTNAGVTAVYKAPESLTEAGKITITNDTTNATKDVAVKFVIGAKPADTHMTTGNKHYGVGAGLSNEYYNATYASADNYPEAHGMKANLAKLVPVYTSTSSSDLEGYATPKGSINAESYEYIRMLVYYDTGADGVVDDEQALNPSVTYGATYNKGSTVAYTLRPVSETYKTGRWEYIYYAPADDGFFGFVNQARYKIFGGLAANKLHDDVIYLAELSLIVDAEDFKQYKPVELAVEAGKIGNVAADVEFSVDGGDTWTAVAEAENYNAAAKTLIFNDGATVQLRYAAKAATETVGAYAASEATEVIVEAAATAQYVVKFESDYTEHDDMAATEGGTIVLPAPAQADIPAGCTFLGWTDGENEYDAGDEYTVNGNATLTAMWEQTEFLITYETDYGTAPAEAWTTNGGKLTVADALSYDAYSFDGWQVKGTDTVFAVGTEQTFTANTTLVAVWTLDTTLVLKELYINAGKNDNASKMAYFGVTADMLAVDSDEITITLPYGWSESVVPQAGEYDKSTNPAVIVPVAEGDITAAYTAPGALSEAGKITITNTAKNTKRDVAVKFVIDTVAPADKAFTNHAGMYAVSSNPGIVNVHYGSYQSFFEEFNTPDVLIEIGEPNYHGKENVAKFIPIYEGSVLDGVVRNASGNKFLSSSNTQIEGSGTLNVGGDIKAYNAGAVAQYRVLVYYDTVDGDQDAEFTPNITYQTANSYGNITGSTKASLISDNYKTGRWEYLYFAHDPADGVFGWTSQPKYGLLGSTSGKDFENDVLYVAEIARLTTAETFKQYMPVELDTSVAGRIGNVDADVEYSVDGINWIAVTSEDDTAVYDAATKTLSRLATGEYQLRYAAKAATETVGAYEASEAATVTVTAPTVYYVTYETEFGTAPEAIEVTIGESFQPAAAPVSEGNVFDGWRIDDTDVVIPAGEDYTPTSDMVLTAVWKKSVTGSVKVVRADGNAPRSYAKIKVYNAEGTLVAEEAIENAATVTTDGVFTFDIKLLEGEYTAVITKNGYIDAEIAQFTVGEDGATIALVELVAGDVEIAGNAKNEIDMLDFAAIIRTFDADENNPLTDDQSIKYDIDENGSVGVTDLDYIKENYGAKLAD